MDISSQLGICREALGCALLVAAPLLLAAMAGGTLASIVQSALRIQDTTPLLIVRIVSTAIAIVVLMPWLTEKFADFATVAWGTSVLATAP